MIDKIKLNLANNIELKLYNHSLRVMMVAKELAKIYGEDVNKAALAGLLHDCGKIKDETILLKRAREFDILLDNIMSGNKVLIHGPLGAKIAEKEYNIVDKSILDAIYYHTTGRENMTLLDKITYIADFIEPERDFPGVEYIRELAYIDIDKSLLLAMDNTIKFTIDRGNLIHVDTIKARNYMKILEKGVYA